MNKLKPIKTGYVWALLVAFASTLTANGASLDKRVERAVDASLEKRQTLVQSNPLYNTLVADLQHGRKELVRDNLQEAFKIFGDILKNTRYTNFPEYSFSKYYIAATLENMGVYYGALLYYVDIVEKEPLRLHTHESLRKSIELAQKLKDDELILYLASVIPANKVPKSLVEEFRYYVAKDQYHKKAYGKAVRLLESIPHTNRMYLASRYLLGTIYTTQNRFKEAQQYFRVVINDRTRKKYYEETTIKELSSLAIGRLFYELKSYPLSIVNYKKVGRNGNAFPQALYESSWALFKIHKFNEALAVLHSVNSPFFEQIHFLKSYLLKGAIFLELCHYDDAVRSLSEAEKDFLLVGRQIDRFSQEAQTPKRYYQLISSKSRRAKGVWDYKYFELFELVSANPDFRAAHLYILELQSEQQRLNEIKSPRAKLIGNLIKQRELEVINKASYLAGQKLKLTRELVQDFFQLKDILRYEIVSSERKILQTRSLRLAPPVLTDAELIKPKFTESLRESLIWWDYEGEFWKDELGYYLYGLKSLCKDSENDKKTTSMQSFIKTLGGSL
ncbi:MAG: hypothetical protein KDD48_03030 [Bdellovibrionales bacterium]|nr:hypothetical protein [Bdellovibrionales bacterium]